MGKASLPKTSINDTLDANKERKKQFGRERAAFTNVSGVAATAGSGVNATTNNVIQVTTLPTGGGTMMGPIAFYPKLQFLNTGTTTLDISKATDTSYSSRVIVSGQSNAATISTISGAAHAGQILFLQAASAQTITINETGNISIPGSTTSYVMTANEIILLQYDATTTKWITVTLGAGTGTWVGTATSDLNMGSFDIYGVDKLKMVIDNTTAWNAADTGFDFTSTGLHAHVISGDAFEVWSNGTVKNLLAGESGLQVFVSGTKYMDIGASSSDFYSNLYIHDNYMQFTKMTAPTHSVSSYRYLFQDTADNHLKIRTNTGLIDLETSSGGSFPSPVTTDLDMNDNDILGVNLLDFDGTTTEIRGLTNLNFYHTDRQITSTGSYAGLLHTVASSEKHGFLIGGATKMEVSSDLKMSVDIDMNGNDVYDIDQLSFSVSGQYMTGNSTGVNYYVPTGDSHKLYVGTTKIADLGAGSWDSTVDLYMGTNQIKSVGDPTSAQDAATKAYVDANSGGGGSGADTALSNLGTTSINQNLIPSSDDSKDLGTSSKQWRNLYVDGSAYIDAISMGGDIDMNSGEIDDIGELNVDSGGRLNFSGTGYIKSSGSTKITISSSGATFNDDAIFNNTVQMNNDLNMQGGDIDMSSSGRINLVATGGSPGSFDGYVAIKVGGSTKYLQIYS